LGDPISKKTLIKTHPPVVEWIKVKVLSSSPSAAKIKRKIIFHGPIHRLWWRRYR
jgi:hypothetical protein